MNRFYFIFGMAVWLGVTANVHAAITVLDDWHLGESDPGAVNGRSATNTLDSVGGLTLTNQPISSSPHTLNYPYYTNNVSSQADFFAGSSLSEYYTGGQYAVGTNIPNLTTNFGLELWVYPKVAASGAVIVYNGSTSSSGWGIYQSGTNCLILMGGLRFSAGSANLATNQWTDLALVCATNIATLYTNGVPAFTMTNTPIKPSGNFLIAGDNSGAETFSGAVDEVRVFTFSSGQFSSTNLLINGPLVVTTTADSGAGSLRGAMAAAGSGGTITFVGALSGQAITLASTLAINTSLTIDASALPGSIQINGDGTVTIFNVATGVTAGMNSLTITNGNANNANEDGGGIYNSGTLTLNECTLAGNSSGDGNGDGNGGAIENNGTLTLNECTLAGNNAGVAGQGSQGGAIDNSGTLMLNQCTLFGNSAYSGGGVNNNDTLVLNQCTLSENVATGGGDSAASQGGGIYDNYQSTLIMTNTLVAGNIATNGADIFVFDATLTYGGTDLIQSVTNFNNGGVINGSDPVYAAPELAPLGNYGGPTLTMPPLPGSPAIGAGSVVANTFTNDQRGYARTQNGLIDIGAVELPIVSAYTVNTNYGAAPLAVQFDSTNQDSDGATIVDWNWAFGDGTSSAQNPSHIYITGGVFLPGLIVTNSLGLALAVPGPTAIAVTPLIVKNTADSGQGSLRSAIVNDFNGDTITFSPSLSGATITLSSTLAINTSLTIDASALPDGIQVNGNGQFTVFLVGLENNCTVILNSLTITNGVGTSGGGIYNIATLTLNQCTVSGNNAKGGGVGGIYNQGAAILNGCTLSGNAGGGIYNASSTVQLSLDNCTVSGNSTGGNGGGINNDNDALLTLDNCTISGNRAKIGGGGIYGGASMVNTIVSGNTARVDNDIDGTYSATDNFIGGNPQLASLGNYGGPTQTMPPLPGSPVIDAGVDSVTNMYTTDQRGYPRLSGLHVDIGAVEVQFVAANPNNPPVLQNPAWSAAGGTFQYTFTNISGADFTALTSTNVTLPLTEWTILGNIPEISPGIYEFTDPSATNPASFYQVVSP